jgi:hypothetical protein
VILDADGSERSWVQEQAEVADLHGSAFLNVGLRAFPDTGYRAARSLTWLRPPAADDARMNDPRVRVVTPWTAMIVGLLILTIVVNVVLWVA